MGRAKVIPPNTLLLPYQSRWVKDTARLKLAVKSRQIGWTWATGYGLVRRKSVKGATLDAWISSRDEIQARLFLEDCKGFGDLLHVGARDLGESVIDERGNSAFVLSLANGLRLHSMSSNPDAQAGKRGDRVLDEFALHPDPRKLYAIAYPGITWGGSMEIFSTPRGSNSFFQTLIDEIADGNPKHFSFHRITLEDALNQGFLAKLQKKLPPGDERQDMDEQAYFDFIKDGCSDEESFNQEYMCVAADDDGAFIEYELIDRCKIKGEGLTGITDKSYTVENLTANGTFLYRVKALYVNGTESAWSNVEEVTLSQSILMGDVNRDGQLSITDVTALVDYLLDETTDIDTAAADLSGDGAITITDVTSLIDLLLASDAQTANFNMVKPVISSGK